MSLDTGFYKNNNKTTRGGKNSKLTKANRLLLEGDEQCQLSDPISDIVIINHRNHDHRYNKLPRQADHGTGTGAGVAQNETHQRSRTRAHRQANTEDSNIILDIQAPECGRDRRKRRTSLVEEKKTVINERKRKMVVSRDDENDADRSSKTHNHVTGDQPKPTHDNNLADREITKFKFSKGEKVLVYEPDQTKTRVLYDAKVLDCICPLRDKRKRIQYTINGKKTSASVARQLSTTNRNVKSKKPEYLIHFSGWSSTWDRLVSEESILADTETNRNLQTDLAKKAAEHLKKNKIKLNKIPAIIKEQVLKTEDNPMQASNINGTDHIKSNGLRCYYRNPKIYLEQALRYRHDHSYAEDGIYDTNDNLINQKSTMASDLLTSSATDSNDSTTSQSSSGSLNINRRPNLNTINGRLLSSSQVGLEHNSRPQRSAEQDFIYFKFPKEMKIYLENDRNHMESSLATCDSLDQQQLDKMNSPRRERNMSSTDCTRQSEPLEKSMGPSARVTSRTVHAVLEEASQYILNNNRQYNYLDDGNALDSSTARTVMGNFEGLLKEFQNSLEIYFDALASGDYLYYNEKEKQHYMCSGQPKSTSTPFNSDNTTVVEQKSITIDGSIDADRGCVVETRNEANNGGIKRRPINVLNETHLVRFIALLPEFLNATPDLTWRHQQIISFFLNQLIKYLIENVIQNVATSHTGTTTTTASSISATTATNSNRKKTKLPMDTTPTKKRPGKIINKSHNNNSTGIKAINRKIVSRKASASVMVSEKRIKK